LDHLGALWAGGERPTSEPVKGIDRHDAGHDADQLDVARLADFVAD
jgi:hypothetical protein